MAAVGLLVLVLLALATPFMFRLTGQDGRISLPAKTTFTSGSYYAFANPWAVQDRSLLGLWAHKSESIWIDHTAFPDHTRVNWAWPPFSPRNGVGVWGYHHVGYGNYDGGSPEKPVAPRQVKQIRALDTAFAWDADFTFGESTLLTEFYLRSNPQNMESKVLEVGWLLHISPKVEEFLRHCKPVGTYTDANGRRWNAKILEKYLTFSPADGQDLKEGRIDMLHGLRWLKSMGRITGDEWVTGVALGVEPIKGFGDAEIKHWRVDFR